MTKPVSPVADSPIENFSQCHAGILAHLAEFARLPGVGEHKLERYGEAFLAVIREAP